MSYFGATYFGRGSSSGGDVLPITNRLSRFDIFLHVEEEHLAAIPTNEDLSSADIYFSVTNEYEEEILHIADNDLTTRTDSTITIQITSDLTNRHSRLTYSFRNTSDNKVRQKGRIIVDFASFH
jgi:hypothetical protein